MITNGFSSASSSTYTVPDASVSPSPIPLESRAQTTTNRAQEPAVTSHSPRQQLQQFVTVLFQALEQNQAFIQQQNEKNQAKMKEEQAQQTKRQNPYTSDKPPLVKDLESLVTRLSDKSSNNNGKGNATPQLQQLYQETPLRSAYPNLPLGSMLQALQQSLDSSNPDSLPHQGTLLDTQA